MPSSRIRCSTIRTKCDKTECSRRFVLSVAKIVPGGWGLDFAGRVLKCEGSDCPILHTLLTKVLIGSPARMGGVLTF